MNKSAFSQVIKGYRQFRQKYGVENNSLLRKLGEHGQTPEVMVVACSDSRVDPALLLQSEPGDLFVVRNVANLIPPYEKDEAHHGTSAALEFGICYLNIKHLIILGHSQCGGIDSWLHHEKLHQDDFISNWLDLITIEPKSKSSAINPDAYAKQSLLCSYENCLTFPWINSRLADNTLTINLWFFDIKTSTIYAFDYKDKEFKLLDNLEV